MKRQNFAVTDVGGVEGQRKLDHYNQWLLDPHRPFGTTYSGYEESNYKTLIPDKNGRVLTEKKPNKIKKLQGRKK